MSSSLFGGKLGGLGTDLLTRAAGAFMRGESPQDFLRSIARSHPAFRQINANDLEGEMHRICKERGIDEGQIINQVKDYLSKL